MARWQAFEMVANATVEKITTGVGTVQFHEAAQYGITRASFDVVAHMKDAVPDRMQDIQPPGSDGQTLPTDERLPFKFERTPDLTNIAHKVHSYEQVAQDRVDEGKTTKLKVRGRYGDQGEYHASIVSDAKSAKKQLYAGLEDLWLRDNGNNEGNPTPIPWRNRMLEKHAQHAFLRQERTNNDKLR